jgi:hypothetical protein
VGKPDSYIVKRFLRFIEL